MAITVTSDTYLKALKTGLSKVKDAISTIESRKGLTTFSFSGSAVTYSCSYATEGKGFDKIEVDASLLYKLTASYNAGDLELAVDGSEFKVRKGRSSVKVACTPTSLYVSEEDAIEDTITEDGLFHGWIKNHPLRNAQALKRALQSIKDNVSKSELIVEAEWGKSDLLKVKIVDQFHGILAYVKLDTKPMSKKVRIRVPISSFLLLLDTEGDLYVDATRVAIKSEAETLSCRFVAVAAYGTIDEMAEMFASIKPQVTVSAKDLSSVVKRVSSIAESDDIIEFTSVKERLAVQSSTLKATVKESLQAEGKFKDTVRLAPKNLNDIVSCMANTVELTDVSNSILFKSVAKDITIYGAIVKREG